MTDSKEALDWLTKDDRRSVVDRRQFSYTVYIPERRCGKDRRNRKSKERNYMLDIEDDSSMRTEEVHLTKY
jgi:hypothetical protein